MRSEGSLPSVRSRWPSSQPGPRQGFDRFAVSAANYSMPRRNPSYDRPLGDQTNIEGVSGAQSERARPPLFRATTSQGQGQQGQDATYSDSWSIAPMRDADSEGDNTEEE
jgi:hypothetical protein